MASRFSARFSPVNDAERKPHNDCDNFMMAPVAHMYADNYDEVLDHQGMLEYPVECCPPSTGRFVPDVLCTVLMYLETKEEVLAASGTCTMWRFYGNYLPHWTQLHQQQRLFPYYFLVPCEAKTILTRDELLIPYSNKRRAMEADLKRKASAHALRSGLEKCLWLCLIPLLVVGLIITVHFVVAWSIGINHNNIFGDVEIGGATFGILFLLFSVEFLCALGANFYQMDHRTPFIGHFFRLLAIIFIVTFTLLLPVGLLGGRTDSAQTIVDGGTTSHAQRLGDLQQETEVPVRAYFQLAHPLGETNRWAHFPTQRRLDEKTYWCNGACQAPSLTEEQLRDGVNMTRRIHYRTIKNEGRGNHKGGGEAPDSNVYGSFFLLYDVTTKPQNVSNDASLWGTATDPHGFGHWKPGYTPDMTIVQQKRSCYHKEATISEGGYGFMNCLHDYATSPEWNGTTFIAIRGNPEDFAFKFHNSSLRDAKALSYRTVRRTANFNSEYSYGEEFWWQRSTMNRWWSVGGVYLLESDWPETLQEGQQRVDNHYHYCHYMLVATVLSTVGLCFIPLFFSNTPNGRRAGFDATIVILIVLMNPISVATFGGLCYEQSDDPRTRDESWLMCQQIGGIALLVSTPVSLVFLLVVTFFARSLRSRDVWYM